MVASPEALIFHAIKHAAGGEDAAGERPVRSDDEATQLTNAVLTTLHQAGYRILLREGGAE